MRNRRLAILLLVLAVWLCSAPANLLAAAADNALHDFARAIIDSDDPPPAGWQACSNFCFSPASPAMRTDGETRVIGAGEVFLVEDTHGKGHFSKAVEGKFRHSLFIPID